jgi:hypothetical protein
MTLFTLDDVLRRPMRARVRDANQTRANPELTARLDAFPYIPHGTLTPELGFSAKHGPFIEFLAERDLRTVQREIASPTIRSFATHHATRQAIPSQVVGFRTGLTGGVRYEVLWSDVVAAGETYSLLRQRAKVRSQQRGNLVVDYGDKIMLRVYGLQKGQPCIIDADLSGVPPSGEGNPTHAPHYRLETLTSPRASGVFHVDSGYAQHRGKNWTTYVYHPNPLSSEATIVKRRLLPPQQNSSDAGPRASKPLVERVALYAGDLLGLYLLDGVVRRQYGVALNQPLPPLQHIRYALHARVIGSDAIMLDENDKRHRPSKTEWNHLIGQAISW